MNGLDVRAEIVEPAVADLLRALPGRGSRPRTSKVLPHVQLDQWPSATMIDELHWRATSLPNVLVRESRMALAGTAALYVSDRLTASVEAFIDGNEFCHLHGTPDGSVHLTLPHAVRDVAIDCGWAESHPAVQIGAVSRCLVLVYAPRDEQELTLVTTLVHVSWKFAAGGL